MTDKPKTKPLFVGSDIHKVLMIEKTRRGFNSIDELLKSFAEVKRLLEQEKLNEMSKDNILN